MFHGNLIKWIFLLKPKERDGNFFILLQFGKVFFFLNLFIHLCMKFKSFFLFRNYLYPWSNLSYECDLKQREACVYFPVFSLLCSLLLSVDFYLFQTKCTLIIQVLVYMCSVLWFSEEISGRQHIQLLICVQFWNVFLCFSIEMNKTMSDSKNFQNKWKFYVFKGRKCCMTKW